jgi:hypothetical protein
MNLFRLLLLAAALWVVWRLWRAVQARLAPPPAPGGDENFEPMARCQRCGAHLPVASLTRSGHCIKCAE